MEFRILFFTLFGIVGALQSRPHLVRPVTDSAEFGGEAVLYGGNNFGDIMGGCQTNVGTLGNFLNMERVVLTANGNLQRIMSAHYAAPVDVHIKKCDKIGENSFDREVELMVFQKVFCTAIGKIYVNCPDCLAAIDSKAVGVGQLFRYLNVLPSFHLLDAGRSEEGLLWREYRLWCPQVHCFFRETFEKDFLTFGPP